MRQRFFMFLGLIALATLLVHPKGFAIGVALGVNTIILIFCCAGIVDGMLAMVGAPTAFADKILKAIGLLK